MEKAYKERLKGMDAKLREVRDKERRIAQMERLQSRSLEKCGRLQADILNIKQQKVCVAPSLSVSHECRSKVSDEHTQECRSQD